jgi:hypothetical protein
MTDVRAEDLDEGDRLPWLEAVEDDDGGDGPSALKLIVAVLIGLAAIGAIVGGLFWLGNRHSGGGGVPGEIETIKAPQGPYKVRPQNPGGMTVKGEGDTSLATSAGVESKGRIDANKMPEAPVTAPKGAAPAAQPAQPRPSQPKAAPAAPQQAEASPQKPAPAKAAPAPSPSPASSGQGGGSIQLGAFSSQAGAEKAWKALSGRFSYVAPLNHSVIPVTSGGRTLYRLRAGGAGAGDVCTRLRVAGESCVTLD